MNLIRIFVMLLSVVLGLQTSAAEGDAKLKVLVITGGHGFDEAPFFKMFSDNPEITFMHAAHARTNATVYEREDLGGYRVQPKVTPLISTTHPKSGKPLGWAHTYRKSRVVCLQLGHGPEAFNDGTIENFCGKAFAGPRSGDGGEDFHPPLPTERRPMTLGRGFR